MRLIVEVTSFSQLKRIINIPNIGYIVVGLTDFSIDTTYDFSESEVVKIVTLAKKKNIKTILNVARIFHEDEINQINKLQNWPVDYYLYSDLAIWELLSPIIGKDHLIYYNPTYVTNRYDAVILKEYNGMVVLSNQINMDELQQIANHLQDGFIIDVFGRATCFYSRRLLLSNYFEYYRLKPTSLNGYNIKEELREETMPIIQSDYGTRILEGSFHYILEEIINFPSDSLLMVNCSLLDKKRYEQVIAIYSEFLSSYDYQKANKLLHEIIPFLNKGAYNIKTTLLKEGNGDE